MKKIILSALVLALSSGAAMADRFHGGRGGGERREERHEERREVEHHDGGWRGGGNNGGWHGNVVVHERGGYDRGYDRGYNRGYYNTQPRYYHNHGVVRSNIWLERPVIRSHYYEYDYRPRVIFENYGARDGYIFVAGEWQWSGYEWIWQPGHYEPDPSYEDVY